MKRLLVIFLALTILNQSIDYDYLNFDAPMQNIMTSFDDIDCISEFVIEKIMNNDSYTSEEDDDSGNPQNKEGFKIFSFQDILPPPEKISCISFPIHDIITKTWSTSLDLANKTSKGYFNISSPPPDFI